MEKKNNNAINIKNKRAEHEYFLMDRLTAGIALTGTEIKSIRNGKASLAESYCTFKGDELFVVGMHIAEYDKGTYNNHDPKRDRKLLLTARELRKFKTKVQEKGFTIIPVLLFINEKGLAKLDIALARGKHYYDKRETLKTKDSKRDVEKQLKGY
ncbi:MAG: SsrA-binding protein SmpB [Bacteroidales bacterium]|jgi:SsrA-binding protein|nr:SsrA-binding protein SmpB [Bacteroidales bacterium]MBR6846768.1 SsrA-binding protein SmpB [Bacteroidales bacterium]